MSQQNSNMSRAAGSVGTSSSPATNVGQHLAQTGAIKAAGGGLEAGTTDFGPSTSSMSGGGGAAGSGAARSTGSGNISGSTSDGAPSTSPGMSGAAGLSVNATGRPMNPDGGPSGAVAFSGTGDQARTDGGATTQPISQVSQTSQKTGASSDGRRARPADLANDRAAAPNLIAPTHGEEAVDLRNGPDNVVDQTKDAMDRAGDAAGGLKNPLG